MYHPDLWTHGILIASNKLVKRILHKTFVRVARARAAA